MAGTKKRAAEGVTAPLLAYLMAQAAIHREPAKHEALDAELVAMGYQPLTTEQVECLNSPELADEAADMLDDMQARLGVSAAACEAALAWHDAQAIRADLAYNIDKAGRAHREHDAGAMRLQMQYGTVDGK